VSRTLILFDVATQGVNQSKTTSDETHKGACSYSMQREAQKDTFEVSASNELLSSHRGFEELLLEAIDKGLSPLGDPAKRAIYLHLEETFNISKRDIPHKIRAFAEALETTFGNGARLLEIEMMRSLYERVHCSFEYSSEDDLTFAAYVEAVRRALRSQTMTERALCRRLSKFL
jgi:hypothetical protein